MNKTISENFKFNLLVGFFVLLIAFALFFDSVNNISIGLIKIILTTDLLITDYLGIGGLGATFINAGILGLLSLFLLKFFKIELDGSSISAVFTVAGFAMFGKNLLNVIPIVMGVWLYSLCQKEYFKDYVLIALYATCLSPLVSQILNIYSFSKLGFILALFTGVLVGFILPPLSAHLSIAHQGFSLYNLGFVAGILGTLIMSILRGYGVELESTLVWTTEYTNIITVFLFIYFCLMILLGYVLNERSFEGLKELWIASSKKVNNFIKTDGFAVTMINMGIMGIIFILLLRLINSPLNGPTVGGIFTIVGFSSFGKHPFNTMPIVAGVLLGAVMKIWSINDPGLILALLFCTTLAPITGVFGKRHGLIAGFLHLSVVMNIGYLHGGLNLYNNGFSGGIVAVIMYPLLNAFKKNN